MPDSVLVAVPLLVFVVVLLLGFTGCERILGLVEVGPGPTLTLRASVPVAVAVVAPGVTFAWTRPASMQEETIDVGSPVGVSSIDGYIATALGLGPSLFWTLGSGTGLTDRSSNGHDGMALGGVTVGGDQDGPTDFADATATLFDGTDDGIRSSYNPFVGTDARTFVGWSRWDAGGANEYTLFGSTEGDNNRPNLRVVVASRDVKWLPSGDDGQVVTWPGAAPPEATWFMWTLVADPANGTATLFIDDTKLSQQTITEAWPGSPGTFQVALGASARHPFKGAQGLVLVYEKALTDSDVSQLSEASHGINFYEYEVPSALGGGWLARCEMTVQADGASTHGDSSDYAFTLPSEHLAWGLSFQAEGSPLGPPFKILVAGLNQD